MSSFLSKLAARAVAPFRRAKAPATFYPLTARVFGRARAEATVAHLRRQHAKLARMWYQTAPGTTQADAYQAGCAATACMADVLDAVLANDRDAFVRAVESLVNDGVESGAVPTFG